MCMECDILATQSGWIVSNSFHFGEVICGYLPNPLMVRGCLSQGIRLISGIKGTEKSHLTLVKPRVHTTHQQNFSVIRVVNPRNNPSYEEDMGPSKFQRLSHLNIQFMIENKTDQQPPFLDVYLSERRRN